MKKVFLFWVAAFLLTGCATTGDPTKGGIFWSEDKAKIRLDNQRHMLSQTKAAAAQTKKESQKLSSRKSSLQAEIFRQEKILASLDRQVRQLKVQLVETKNLSSAKLAEKQKAEQELERIQQEITTLQNAQNKQQAAVARKKKKIEELSREIDSLLEILTYL